MSAALPKPHASTPTAAMAAGVVNTLMSSEDLFDAVMGEGYAMAA